MTTMTLTTAPPARRSATRRRPTWDRPTAVRGCAGPEETGAGALPAAPVATAIRSTVGLAPLHTSPTRLTRRGRVAVTLGFLAVLGGGLAVGQATIGTTTAPTASYDVVTIQPGQTLWSIATEVAPGVDPRLTVERLVAVNGLVDANAITAGDQLSVPVVR